MKWRVAALLPLVLGWAAASEEFTIAPARVDAVVTDPAGRPVPDLKPEEFELRLGGQPQKIARVTHMTAGPRAVVFIVDDTGMSAAELGAVRQALGEAAALEQEAGGFVSVVSVRGGSGFLRTQAAAAALEELVWKPPLTASLHEAAVLDTLARAAAELKRMPGGKMVAVLSAQPFVVSELRRVRAQSLAEEVVRSSVALDWIHLRPGAARAAAVSEPPYRWEESVSSRLPGERALRRQVREYSGSESLGAYLTAQTGGLLLAGLAELPAALGDAAGTYRIEWTPEPERKTRPDRQRLEVKVARAGVKVRLEGDFTEDAKRDEQPRRTPPRERVQRALFSLFEGAEIPVRLTAVFGRDESASPYLDFLLHLGPRGIELRDAGEGCFRARIETVTTVQPFDSNLDAPIQGRVSDLRVCGGNADWVRRYGLALTLREKTGATGLYQARVAVRNVPPEGGSALDRRPRLIGPEEAEAAPIGAASQVLEAPGAKKREPAVSGLVLAAAGSSAAGYRPATAGDAAIRRFRPGQTVAYRFQAPNAREARIRILRDGRETASAPVTLQDENAAGEYRLADSLDPGAYVLEAAAGAASQWIDFQVVK